MNDVKYHSFDRPTLGNPPGPTLPQNNGWADRALRIAWWSLLVVGGGTIGLALGLFLWLCIAPVPLGFFAADFEKTVNDSVPNMRVKIGDVSFSWGPGFNKAGFQLYDVDIYADDGTLLVNVPQADMHFAADGLLDGTLAPKRVELTGVSATLTRLADGSFKVGVNKGPVQVETPQRASEEADPRLFESILSAMLAPPDAAQPSSYLSYFGVRDANLTMIDEATGTTLRAPSAYLALERGQEGVSARVNGGIDLDGEPWSVAAQANYTRGADRIRLEASFSDVLLSALAKRGAFFAGLSDLAVPVGGMATGEVELGGSLIAAELWLKAGAGALHIPAISERPVKVERAEFAVVYDAQNSALNIESLSIDAEGNSGHFAGRGKILSSEGRITGMEGELAGEAVTIELPALFDNKFMLDRLALRGTIDASQSRYVIDNASFRAGDFEAVLKGEISGGAATALKLEGQFTDLPATKMLTYWPKFAADGARSWIARNVFDGMIPKAVLKLDIPAGGLDAEFIPDDQMRFDFNFENLEASYLSGLTHVSEAKGSGTVFGDTFRASVQSAKIGPIKVTGGDIHIPTLHVARGPGNFNAVAEGKISDIITLIDMEPLGYAKRFGLSPAGMNGTGRVDLAFVVPMKKDLPVEELSFDINADIKDMSVAFGEDLSIEEGAAKINIDGQRLAAKGSALINKMPLQFDWVEKFQGKGLPTNLTISGTFDEAAQKALPAAAFDRANGPVKVAATLRGRGKDIKEAQIEIGLTDAIISVKELNWFKPATVPATATADLVFGKDASISRIENVKVAGTGIDVQGAIDLTKTGDVTKAEFPQIKLGERNSFAAEYEHNESGSVLTLSGNSLDGGRIIKDIFSDSSSGPVKTEAETPSRETFRVAGRFNRLYMREGAYIQGADLSVLLRGNELETLSVKGSSPKSAPILASIATQASGQQRVQVETTDAGTLLKGVTGFKSVVGGKLSLLADLNPTEEGSRSDTAGTSSGLLRIEDFRIVDQPFLARLFAVGSLTGIGDLLNGSGISFHTLELPFNREESRWQIKKGARAAGTSLGITADGYIDSDSDAVVVSGTMVPIYGVNSFLGDVPLLGPLLTGGEGEGIFGLEYGVSGTADNLKLKVNPLSLIAPGIFRDMFKYDSKPVKAPKKKPAPR